MTEPCSFDCGWRARPRRVQRSALGHLTAWVALVGALAACGSDSSEEAPQALGGEGGQDAGSTDRTCTDDGQLDLDGTFVLDATLSFEFSSQPGGAVTVCPEDQTSDGSFLGLLRLQHEPGQQTVKLEAVVCTLELPIISAIVGQCHPDAPNLVYAGLEFPEALIRALPVASVGRATGTLRDAGTETLVDFSRITFTVGTPKTGDEMPAWQETKAGCNDVALGRGQQCAEECVSACEELVDHDHDGYPGVSVHVCGYTDDDRTHAVACNPEEPSEPGTTIQGRAMLDMQVDPLMQNARVASSCAIEGPLDAHIRYNVIGADLYVTNTQISVVSATRSLPVYEVQPDSRFWAVRIDGKYGSPNWDADFSDPVRACAAAIARRNEIK